MHIRHPVLDSKAEMLSPEDRYNKLRWTFIFWICFAQLSRILSPGEQQNISKFLAVWYHIPRDIVGNTNRRLQLWRVRALWVKGQQGKHTMVWTCGGRLILLELWGNSPTPSQMSSLAEPLPNVQMRHSKRWDSDAALQKPRRWIAMWASLGWIREQSVWSVGRASLLFSPFSVLEVIRCPSDISLRPAPAS